MRWSLLFSKLIRRALATLLVAITTGCSLLAPGPPIAEEPLPAVTVDESVLEPEPPGPPPQQPTQPPPATTLAPPETAIVLSDGRGAFQEVATELEYLLDGYAVYNLGKNEDAPAEVFAAIEQSSAAVVVAIGLKAAREARERSSVPVVFCQVFNVAEHRLLTGNLRGVSATPPLDLQLGAWTALDPQLGDIGMIVGEGHEALIAEAERAARDRQMSLHVRVARSDRETMYLFDRLVANIDGFWLFPDNRILSRAVLHHVFSSATERGVQVAVFNESLLQLGAAISATTVSGDIAATTAGLLARMVKGDTAAIPAVTPLTEASIRINEELAGEGRSMDAATEAVSRIAGSP